RTKSRLRALGDSVARAVLGPRVRSPDPKIEHGHDRPTKPPDGRFGAAFQGGGDGVVRTGARDARARVAGREWDVREPLRRRVAEWCHVRTRRTRTSTC